MVECKEINTVTKTSTHGISFSRELPVGARQKRSVPNSFLSGSAENALVGGDGCARYCAYGLLGPDEAAGKAVN